jgi:glycerol-3-phosphate acyltransferase PlsY
LTALSDGLKGAVALWLARGLSLNEWGVAIAGTLAVVGHNYSLFLNFKGGAGTGTSVGVAAVPWVWNLPILVLSGAAVGLLVGHASVASILIAVLLPVLFGLRGEAAYAIGFGLPTMLLTLWALRPNIQRLARRAERFLPIYGVKPPLIRLSRHPSENK